MHDAEAKRVLITRGASTGERCPPILMIVGTGRSGTTLLEKVLGSYGGAVAIGEASYLWERGFLANHLCSDGIPFRDHPLWKAILCRAFSASPDPRIQERLRHRVEHSRWLPLLMLGGRRHDVDLYCETWRRLFRAIAVQTQARVIVDASKSPVRAWLLRSRGLDVRVVHIVRDLEGVIASWSRPKADPGSGGFLSTKGPLVTALFWTLHHVLSALLLARTAYTRIDLDSFLEAPLETTRRLWTALDLEEPGPSSFVDRRHFRAKPDLAFSGNPDRFTTGIVEVRQPMACGKAPSFFLGLLGRAVMHWLRPRREHPGRPDLVVKVDSGDKPRLAPDPRPNVDPSQLTISRRLSSVTRAASTKRAR